MAYLIGTDWAFNHIPKTGGTYVIEALRKSGYNVQVYGPGHEPYWGGDRNVFCYVRHPLSWLRSLWMFTGMQKRLKTGWMFEPRAVPNFWDCLAGRAVHQWHGDTVEGDGFVKFIERSLTERPGLATMTYRIYSKNAYFVGRQERLDLGIFPAAHLADRVNVSEGSAPLYPTSLAKEIMELEWPICQQYGYHEYKSFCEGH